MTWNKRIAFSAIVSVAISANALAAQWPPWPAARSTHVMVWHDRLGEALLLGGVEGDSSLWGWDGRQWRARAYGEPAGRAHFGMAWDAYRDRLIVHGGVPAVFGVNNPRPAADTWEWDGRRWRRVSTEGPGERDHHAMVYDPVRRVTVLFGGHVGENPALSDTWAWNGRAWTRLTDRGPPGRSTHRMVFDSRRNRIVMFGGWGANGLLNDTWAWDGQRWTQLSDSGPAPRFATRIAYDARRDRVVLFGGRGQSSDFGDTWEFDGQAWHQLEVAGPSIRNVHAMVYDPRRRSVLLFGGYNAPRHFDDLWSFDGDAWQQIPRTDAVLPRDGVAPPGPYAVGYRLINHWDHSRATQPAKDFEGRAFNGERATPMQVSLWYPAMPGGTPVTIAYYRSLFGVRSTLAEPAEADVSNAGAALQAEARFQLGLDLPRAQANAIAAAESRARRDAPPADGRFPLIVGGLEGATSANGLAEYLASHGYVVITSPSLPRTATQQVTQPQVALETQTRNLEIVYSIARELPFADADRLALIGYNFDGMAALVHQMRNMTASAVVSMDGWEAKDSARTLRASPYYDVTRMRVPYLLFSQANPPSSQLAFDSVIVDQLRYAERYAFVVKDMEHAQLLGDQRIFPQLSRERRLGYDFVYRTVRTFLDAFVRADSSARVSLTRNAVERGFAQWLATAEVRRPALRAVPTTDEVEAIAMSGDIAKLAAIYREAVQGNPRVQLFSRGTLALFAFRFAQRGQRETAIALHQLAIEAFPRSAIAQNDLGNAYRDAGNQQLALLHWGRALELVDQDPEIETPDERAQSRANIEQKLRASRR